MKIKKKEEDRKKISDLIPDKKNFNKHTEFGTSLLENSLRKFGAGRSILIDKNNQIIAGNGIIETAGAIGIDDIQIIETDGKRIIAVKRTDIDLESPQGREMALADNQTAVKNILIDEFLVEEILGEEVIKEWGVEGVRKEVTEDDFELPPIEEVKTEIKRGDLFEITDGKLIHKLYCGDSTKKEYVEKLMNGENAEILFTSPPYSDMRTYGGKIDLSIDKLIDFIPAFSSFVNYQIINLGIQRKDNEIVQYWDGYIKKAKECGYKFLSWNVWNRDRAGSIGQQTAMFAIYHEWIFVFGKNKKLLNRNIAVLESSKKRNKYKPGKIRQKDGSMKKKGKTKFHDFREMGTVLTTPIANTISTGNHPAIFPIKLPAEYIKVMTKEKDIVCEPFLGSGTTMIAAHQLGRKCFGFEISPEYCEIIIQRMKKLDSNIKINKI